MATFSPHLLLLLCVLGALLPVLADYALSATTGFLPADIFGNRAGRPLEETRAPSSYIAGYQLNENARRTCLGRSATQNSGTPSEIVRSAAGCRPGAMPQRGCKCGAGCPGLSSGTSIGADLCLRQ